MSGIPPALVPIRQLPSSAPVLVVPYFSNAWLGISRIKSCEIYALPDGTPAEIFDPIWWAQLIGRDVSFWPIDAWSGHVFTLIWLELGKRPPFKALRWVWPKTGSLGEIRQIETIFPVSGISK